MSSLHSSTSRSCISTTSSSESSSSSSSNSSSSIKDIRPWFWWPAGHQLEQEALSAAVAVAGAAA